MNEGFRFTLFMVAMFSLITSVGVGVPVYVIAEKDGKDKIREEAYQRGLMTYDCKTETYSWKPQTQLEVESVE